MWYYIVDFISVRISYRFFFLSAKAALSCWQNWRSRNIIHFFHLIEVLILSTYLLFFFHSIVKTKYVDNIEASATSNVSLENNDSSTLDYKISSLHLIHMEIILQGTSISFGTDMFKLSEKDSNVVLKKWCKSNKTSFNFYLI